MRLPHAALTPIAVSLMAATVVFITVGSTLPSWGPRLGTDAWLLWLRDLLAAPEVVLVPPRPLVVEMLDVRDVRFRLYRRQIEIRDAALLFEQV